MRRSGALAGGLLVGWLMSGCGAEPAQEEVATQEQLQTEEPTGPRAPVLETLEFVPSDLPSAATPGLLRARLAEGENATQVLLTGDDGRELALRDDGFGGDERAGDGVFSGLGVVDLEEHRNTQNRIASFQKQSTEPLTVATFADRVLVKETPLTPLPADIFAVGRPIPLPPSGIAQAVVPNKSLIITHSSVVGDTTRTWDPCTGTGNPNGVWTFKHLMTEMANTPATGIQPSAFTERWLSQWLASQTVNGRSVPARMNMATQILNQWPRLTTGELDLNRSSFKLVAIINRLDLGRGRSGAYGTSGAGELRFVFAAMNPTTCQRPDYASFLVIFEYGVPRTQCLDVKGWARAWLNLSDPLMSLGSPAYNQQLQNLTQQVVVRDAALGKPNGSAINQLRTNENLLTNPWELREFRLFSTAAVPRRFTTTAVPGYLSEHVTVRTPFDLFNNSTTLTNFLINQNGPILAGVHDVPLDFGAAVPNFLGAFPWMPTTGFFWNAPNLNTVPNGFNARHKFSLNTCSGCHARETSTPFVHVSATGALSPFLATGMTNVLTPYNVADPVSGQVRSFFEMRDRAQHLDSAANQSCLVRGFDLPSLASH